jgi:uncharacterized protein (TIGR00251 family)
MYRVKVTSPPVDGKANGALIALLAKVLGIPKAGLEIIRGRTSRIKTVRVRGLSMPEIRRILEKKGTG